MKFKNLKKIRYYFNFTKPGISRAQILTVSIGYFLAKQEIVFNQTFFYLIAGTYLFSSSAGGLNNLIEKKHDALMDRTKKRALVTSDISVVEALFIIIICFAAATFLLYLINVPTLLVAIGTVLIYGFIYTPLKRISWINTLVGAIPGALPVLGGWLATETPIHIAIIAVFFSLFSWQIPHFYALSIMYLNEYKNAGFKMLPINDDGFKSTKRQILIFTILMILSSTGPFLYGYLSEIYLVGVLVISIIFFMLTIKFIKGFTNKNARKLFILSIIYLPLWLSFIIIDILLN